MRCTRLIGHKWTKWRKRFGAIQKMENSEMGRYVVYRRRCVICGYTQSDWRHNEFYVPVKGEE